MAFASASQVLAFTGSAPGVVIPGCAPGEVMLWRLATRPENALASSSGPVAFAIDGRCLALWRVNPGPGPSTDDWAVPAPHVARQLCPGLILASWHVSIGQPTRILRGDEDNVWIHKEEQACKHAAATLEVVGPPVRDGPTDEQIESARRELESIMTASEREKLHAVAGQYAPDAEGPEPSSPTAKRVSDRTIRRSREQLLRDYGDRI